VPALFVIASEDTGAESVTSVSRCHIQWGRSRRNVPVLELAAQFAGKAETEVSIPAASTISRALFVRLCAQDLTKLSRDCHTSCVAQGQNEGPAPRTLLGGAVRAGRA